MHSLPETVGLPVKSMLVSDGFTPLLDDAQKEGGCGSGGGESARLSLPDVMPDNGSEAKDAWLMEWSLGLDLINVCMRVPAISCAWNTTHDQLTRRVAVDHGVWSSSAGRMFRVLLIVITECCSY